MLNFFGKLIRLSLTLAFLWGIGLCFFIIRIPSIPSPPIKHTDAIVVVTGGPNRISAAINLLEHGQAPLLFISGVGTQQSSEAISNGYTPKEGSAISLGHKAKSTVGNAVETADWIHLNKVKSFYLVTSAVHMQRCLLEFNRLIPGAIIIPYPIFATDQIYYDLIQEHASFLDIVRNPETLSFIHREYVKYVFALCYIQKLFRHNMVDE